MKTALITGASSGIGKELAIIHAKNGGNLVIVARREKSLLNLKYSLQDEYGVDVEVIVQDLQVDNAAQLVFDQIASNNITIDYLINNAGFGDNQLFKQSDPSRNRMMMQLNMNALTELTHLFVSYWIENKICGKIMNVASTAAFQAVPYFTLYAATKAFVLSFSEGLSLELKNDNITVTALCPGPTKTEFAANSNMDQDLADHKMLPTAEDVARFGYKKMIRGQSVAVHGILNKAGTTSGKLFPRKISAYVAGQIMKKAGKH